MAVFSIMPNLKSDSSTMRFASNTHALVPITIYEFITLKTLPKSPCTKSTQSIFPRLHIPHTDDARLLAHVAPIAEQHGGTVRSAKVARKKGPKGELLSMGFGFVECDTDAVAKAVMKALQGSALDGHHLVVQLSSRKTSTAKANASEPAAAPSSKVVVRNVAFEATRKDVFGLFSPFGHVKSCRLPRKFDGTPRGFAFVEFGSRQEATAAVEALTGTHLYGRRLVIEWATEDEASLEGVQAKTAAKFGHA